MRCNLGTGKGCSVDEIIALAESVTAFVPREYGPSRRAGDPPSLVADPSLAAEVLGWKAAYTDPRAMVETAWQWLTGPKKADTRRIDRPPTTAGRFRNDG